MDIDWRLASGNPFAQLNEGLQQGRENRMQRERQASYQQSIDLQQRKDDRISAEEERQVQAQEEAKRAAQVKQVLQGLTTVPEGQRLAAFQKAAPMLARLGMDANELATTTEDELSNATLSMLGAEIDKAYSQFFQNKSGIYGVTPQGKVDPLQEFPEDPLEVSPGATLYDRKTKRPLYTAPKTYAPPRSGGGGGRPGGGGGLSSVKTADLIAALRQ